MAGLIIGKPVGIFTFSYISIKAKIAQIPDGINFKQIAGAGILGDIGFTMSIFITLLAFQDNSTIDDSKIAIMMGSVLAGVLGYLVLVSCTKDSGSLLLDRQEIIERKAGLSEQQIRESRSHSEQMINIVINASSADTARAQLLALSKANPDKVPDYAVPKGMSKDEFIKRHIDMLSTPWFKYFFTYDPAPVLQKVRCPCWL